MGAAFEWTVPAAIVVISDYVLVRWLLRLSRAAHEQGERVAWLEAKVNGKP